MYFNTGRNRRERSNPIAGGCVMTIVGIIFLAVGFFLFTSTLKFLPGSFTAQGTIVSCVYEKGSCSPTVRFVTQSGQSITIESSSSSSMYHVGDSMPVRYHPDTPQDGRPDTFMETWMFPIICGGAGLLLVLYGPFLLLRSIIRISMGFPI